MEEIKLKEIKHHFGYIADIVKSVLAGNDFPIRQGNEVGTRKSSKTTEWQTTSKILLLTAPEGGVDIYWVRYKVQDAEELMEDILNEFSDIDQLVSNTNKKRRTIKYKGNTLRVLGLHTQEKAKRITDNKVGLQKGNKKYGIVIFEEAHQIPFSEKQALMEAIRGYEYMLEINLSNPWSIYNEFISYCNENVAFDWEKQNTGDCDLFVSDIFDGQKKYFHYSSWINNPYLAEWERENLLNLRRIDPIRARVAVDGMPGLENGAIYADYLHLINDNRELPTEHFTEARNRLYAAGIDWGVVNDTAVVQLWAYDPNYRWVKGLKRAGHNNQPKSPDFNGYKNNIDLTRWVVENIIEWADEIKDIKRKGLSVGVEQAELAVIDMLNTIAINNDLHWLEFYPAPKAPIRKRIQYTTGAMALRNFYYDKEEFKILHKELSMSAWEEPETTSLRNKEPKRIDKDDHDINTMEYALHDVLFNMAELYSVSLLDKEL